MQATILRPGVVIAIPVFNEAERIADCLGAIAAQTGVDTGDLGVVLLLNNCTDATAQIVAALRPDLGITVRVIENNFTGANAGWARREAMEAAACWLEEGEDDRRVILTTDADSRVPHDWIARNLSAIATGVEAVAGCIALDKTDASRLPTSLHARGNLEACYSSLLIELEALIDPLPHDAWPRHRTTSGASLAVRLETYRQVGGMPALALGEDRAFVSKLLSSDVRVRHDPTIVVTTSGRLDGRAVGGAADTMRLRCLDPESFCDEQLQSLIRALFSYFWQRWLRRLHAMNKLHRSHLWAPWLGIKVQTSRDIAILPAFGAVFAAATLASPMLRSRPLRPSQLPANIKLVRIALCFMRSCNRLMNFVRSITSLSSATSTSDKSRQAPA